MVPWITPKMLKARKTSYRFTTKKTTRKVPSQAQARPTKVTKPASPETGPSTEVLPQHLTDRTPLEVIERVIDCLCRSMLPVAALVHQSWYPRAMYILYSTVVIESRTCFDLLAKQIRTSPRVKQYLATTHKLVVFPKHPPRRSAQEDYVPFLDPLPLVFARASPALQVLEIFWELCPVMHPTFYPSLSRFRHLVSLRLYRSRLNSTVQLQRIIRAIPRLEDLTLEDVILKQQADDLLLMQSDIRLKHLLWNVTTGAAFKVSKLMVDYLVFSTICKSLRNLSFHLDQPDELNLVSTQVSRILTASGSCLASFRETHAFALGHLRRDFVHNTTLRNLQLRINIPEILSGEEWLHAADELHTAFSTIRSYQVEHIAVHFKMMFLGRLNRLEFSPSREQLDSGSHGLHDVMVQPYFDTLKAVNAMVTLELGGSYDRTRHRLGDDSIQPILSMFRRLFKPWDARGIVVVSHEVSPQRG